jgi:hypothetical protein
MHPERSAQLKHRYGFDRWNTSVAHATRLFFWNFRVFETAVPDWSMASRRFTPLPTGIGLNRAVFRRGGSEERVMLLDTYECESRESAHAVLIDLMGTYQVPVAFFPPATTGADVEFAMSGEATIVQAIGNLVVRWQSVGTEPEPAGPPAANLVTHLVATPDTPTSGAAVPVGEDTAGLAGPTPEFLGEGTVGHFLPLDLGPPIDGIVRRAPNTEAYVKLVTSKGEPRMRGDRLVYAPEEPGEVTVDMFVVSRETITRRRYALRVRNP